MGLPVGYGGIGFSPCTAPPRRHGHNLKAIPTTSTEDVRYSVRGDAWPSQTA